MRWWVLGAVAPLACGPLGCRSATQIDVVVTTNVPCSQVSGTAITTGSLGAIEDIPSTSTTEHCSSESIGSLVLTPSGDDDALVGFKVVTAINGETIDQCTPGVGGSYGANCIVARRALRYLPHTSLTVDVVMSGQCAGVACDALSTCVEGVCVPATIVDPSACESACGESVLGGADAGLDATVPDGSADAAAPDATIADGSPGDGSVDAALDAPGPSPDGGVLGCDMRGLLAGSPWPMESYCPSGRARSPLVGPDSMVDMVLRWTSPLTIFAGYTPSIGVDGTVYVSSGEDTVKAIDPSDGGLLWNVSPFGDAGHIVTMPILAADQTLRVFNYTPPGSYAVLAFDGGTLLVTDNGFPVRGGVTIGPDNRMYLGDTLGDFDILSPEGGLLQQLAGEGQDYARPSIASNGTFYSTSDDGLLYAFLADGGTYWTQQYDSGSPGLWGPVLAVDGTLRSYSYYDAVFSFDPSTGKLLWQTQLPIGTAGDILGIAVADDGTTYAGTELGLVAYAASNGAIVHQSNDPRVGTVGAPVIDANGNLYAIANNNLLVSFDASCNVRWVADATGFLGVTNDPPVLGPGNMIYAIGNDENTQAAIYAFGPKP